MKKTNIPVVLYCFILSLLIFGCTNAKKATSFMFAHPNVNAPVCAVQFPVKDSIIKGDSVFIYDTLWGMPDVVRDTLTMNDTVRITTTFPARTITKTIRITDTVIKENTARVAQVVNQLAESNNAGLVLSRKNDELSASLSDMKKSRNKFRLWFWIAVGGVGMFTVLKIKKAIGI